MENPQSCSSARGIKTRKTFQKCGRGFSLGFDSTVNPHPLALDHGSSRAWISTIPTGIPCPKGHIQGFLNSSRDGKLIPGRLRPFHGGIFPISNFNLSGCTLGPFPLFLPFIPWEKGWVHGNVAGGDGKAQAVRKSLIPTSPQSLNPWFSSLETSIRRKTTPKSCGYP